MGEDEDEKVKLPSTRLPGKSETWSIKPSSSPSFSTLAPSSELLSKRRRSRVNFWDKMNKFCSIDELDLERLLHEGHCVADTLSPSCDVVFHFFLDEVQQPGVGITNVDIPQIMIGASYVIYFYYRLKVNKECRS